MVRENAHTAHVLYTLWLVLYFIRPPFLSRAPESLAYLCVCSVVSDVLRSMGCSLTSSSVHGLSQARLLEWAAIFLSKGIFPAQEDLKNALLLMKRYHLSLRGVIIFLLLVVV